MLAPDSALSGLLLLLVGLFRLTGATFFPAKEGVLVLEEVGLAGLDEGPAGHAEDAGVVAAVGDGGGAVEDEGPLVQGRATLRVQGPAWKKGARGLRSVVTFELAT